MTTPTPYPDWHPVSPTLYTFALLWAHWNIRRGVDDLWRWECWHGGEFEWTDEHALLPDSVSRRGFATWELAKADCEREYGRWLKR